MADFEVDISAWVKKAKSNADLYVKALALALQLRVQELTPVDTGRLRASVQVQPPIAVVTAHTGAAIGTNVEYARRIEYGFHGVDAIGRHYDQSGRGMFAQTAVEAPEIAKQVAKDLRL